MLRDQLIELLGPVVSELGYELWELEYTGQSGSGLLRLYIDSDEGISVEDCERVSRAVSAAMDVADPIASNYTLEVSSPGLDRVLAKREHFVRFTGEPVRVEMSRPIGGRKRFSGMLVKVEDDAVILAMDGSTVSLPLDGIHRARLAPEV